MRFARTMRCATVGSGTRNARAISGVVSPPSRRRVERDAPFHREDRVARDEHEAKEIVADLVVECGQDVQWRCLIAPKIAAHLLVFVGEALVAPEPIDRSTFRGGHEPGARVVRDARLRPLLEGCDQRILGELLGEAHVVRHTHETGDEPR